MKQWVLLLAFVVFAATARAQSITVGYRQTVSIPAPGALAAFSLDDFYAEVKAQDEILTIFGKNPGLAHIVAVVPEGTKTFEVRVLPAPPAYPPGFVPPLSALAASESGSYESRYTSGPSQSENIIDLMRREGDRSVSLHLDGTYLFTPVAGRSEISLSSVFYRIQAPDRDITVLDQLMTNSPLTVDGSMVRGFHLRQGGFLFHAGYASDTTFENFILPSQKEGVIGVGYRFSLGGHASLTPNLYFFPGSRSSEYMGQRGSVASLVYDYERGKNLGLLAEAGFSRGMAGAATVSLRRWPRSIERKSAIRAHAVCLAQLQQPAWAIFRRRVDSLCHASAHIHMEFHRRPLHAAVTGSDQRGVEPGPSASTLPSLVPGFRRELWSFQAAYSRGPGDFYSGPAHRRKPLFSPFSKQLYVSVFERFHRSPAVRRTPGKRGHALEWLSPVRLRGSSNGGADN